MKEVAYALGIGAISGSRSMLAPALVMNARQASAGGTLMAVLAAAEMVADKSPSIPSRTEPLPLSGRIVSGAAAAVAAASPGHRLTAAAAGAVGALTGAYALYHVRRFVTVRLGLPNAAAGLAEDALAVGIGLMLLQSRRSRVRAANGGLAAGRRGQLQRHRLETVDPASR